MREQSGSDSPGIEVRKHGRVRWPEKRDSGGGRDGGGDRTKRGVGMQALGDDRGTSRLVLQEQIDGQRQARHGSARTVLTGLRGRSASRAVARPLWRRRGSGRAK